MNAALYACKVGAGLFLVVKRPKCSVNYFPHLAPTLKKE